MESKTSNIGAFIKRVRQERNITQKQLVEGLCDVSTLSRIERGIFIPTNYLQNMLLQRLGYYSSRAGGGTWEESNAELTKSHHMQELSKAIKRRDIAEMQRLVAILEKNNEYGSGIELQRLLNSRVILAIYKAEDEGSDIDFDFCTKTLRKSIFITIPSFDESKIRNYVLTGEELRCINTMGGVYFYKKDYESALNILYALKDNLDKFWIDKFEVAGHYTSIMTGIALQLYMLKQYDVCLDACKEAYDFCVEHIDYYRIPALLLIKGKCLAETGKTKEAKQTLRDACHVFRIFRMEKDANEAADYYYNTYGTKINFHQPKI